MVPRVLQLEFQFLWVYVFVYLLKQVPVVNSTKVINKSFGWKWRAFILSSAISSVIYRCSYIYIYVRIRDKWKDFSISDTQSFMYFTIFSRNDPLIYKLHHLSYLTIPWVHMVWRQSLVSFAKSLNLFACLHFDINLVRLLIVLVCWSISSFSVKHKRVSAMKLSENKFRDDSTWNHVMRMLVKRVIPYK